MNASVETKQDPNTQKIQKNDVSTKQNTRIFGVISFIKLQSNA